MEMCFIMNLFLKLFRYENEEKRLSSMMYRFFGQSICVLFCLQPDVGEYVIVVCGFLGTWSLDF